LMMMVVTFGGWRSMERTDDNGCRLSSALTARYQVVPQRKVERPSNEQPVEALLCPDPSELRCGSILHSKSAV
jgi:hypothetical protein